MSPLADRLEGQKAKASVHQPAPHLASVEEVTPAAGSVADSWSTSTAGWRRSHLGGPAIDDLLSAHLMPSFICTCHMRMCFLSKSAGFH